MHGLIPAKYDYSPSENSTERTVYMEFCEVCRDSGQVIVTYFCSLSKQGLCFMSDPMENMSKQELIH